LHAKDYWSRLWAALFIFAKCGNHCAEIIVRKVFNTTVDNSVEKHGSIFVSDSAAKRFSSLHRSECWHFRGIGLQAIAGGCEEDWTAIQF
jgi:hypothetical protein